MKTKLSKLEIVIEICQRTLSKMSAWLWHTGFNGAFKG